MVIDTRSELLRYHPVAIAEILTGTAGCKEGAEQESSVTFDCTLNGEVDAYDVPGTEVFFDWGRSTEGEACGSPELETAAQDVPTEEVFTSVSAEVSDLRPSQTFCFAFAGLDDNVKLSEKIVGKTASFNTPVVPPRIVGQPTASFVTFDSVVMHGELNPENTPTEYFFEYAPVRGAGEKPLAKCPGIKLATCRGVFGTASLQSSLYGKVGTAAGAVGLEPGTTYGYRLAVSNDVGEGAIGQETTFTTARAPSVEAITLPASAITSSGALATGTVAPGGEQATYTFELGVYEGASTNYSPVASGATGTGIGLENESASLTNLQSSTTYAYRIAIDSGYGEARGAPVIFTTSSVQVPTTIPLVPLLVVPSYKFPLPVKACKKGYTRDKASVCVKVKSKKSKPAKKGKGKKPKTGRK